MFKKMRVNNLTITYPNLKMKIPTMLTKRLSTSDDLLINNDYCVYWNCHCYEIRYVHKFPAFLLKMKITFLENGIQS